MKLTNYEWWRTGRLGTLCWIVVGLAWIALAQRTMAQGVTTTTVQGTVYLANGQAGAGTLVVSWPAFTTATGQAVAADSLTYTIPADGFVSVNLAPNVGSLPAGEYYTAVFYMSDGTVSTQYRRVYATELLRIFRSFIHQFAARRMIERCSDGQYREQNKRWQLRLD